MVWSLLLSSPALRAIKVGARVTPRRRHYNSGRWPAPRGGGASQLSPARRGPRGGAGRGLPSLAARGCPRLSCPSA
ncbi:MAG: hypothetical protein J3K34DRAFT_430884 [Monoraphidium minutum]|nr:MAG: hypothetical protein J3K34DRAFT_430884 [Monoraphidium minutum]